MFEFDLFPGLVQNTGGQYQIKNVQTLQISPNYYDGLLRGEKKVDGARKKSRQKTKGGIGGKSNRNRKKGEKLTQRLN